MKRVGSSDGKLGLLTRTQFLVLKERGLGHTQLETADHLGTTRANVSMLEHRARRNLERARATLEAYESTISAHSITVYKGTKLRDLPMTVIEAGDRYKIHLKANLIDLIRVAKSLDKPSAKTGTLSRNVVFTIMQNGKVTAA